MLGYSNAPVYPVPDSTIAEGDRAHVAWLYSGMDYQQPPSIVGIIALTAVDRVFALEVEDRA